MEFEHWIWEPIHWRGGTMLPRWKVLLWFVEEGLRPFLEKHGYHLGCSTQHLANCLATGLLTNRALCHVESEWAYPGSNTGWIAEEQAHFFHILSREVWDDFWSEFGSWADVSPDSFRGQDRRQDIEAFVWRQINLEISPQTAQLADLLLGAEDDDMITAPLPRKTTQDVYLQETLEYNGWGGVRRS